MPVHFNIPDVHTSAMSLVASLAQEAQPININNNYDTEVVIEPVHNSIRDYEGLTGEQIKALLVANRPRPRYPFASTTVSAAINGVCVVIYGTICSILLCFEDAKTRYTELALFAAAILAIMCPAAYSCCEVPRLRGSARRRAVLGCRAIYTLAALSSIAVIACAVLSIVLESMRSAEPQEVGTVVNEAPTKIYLLCGTAIGAAVLQICGGSLVAFMALVDNYR